MVLATDGLWDTMTNEEVVSFVRQHTDQPSFCVKHLTHLAYGRGSLDNITVVLVLFEKDGKYRYARP